MAPILRSSNTQQHHTEDNGRAESPCCDSQAGLREFLLERAQRLVERVECPTDAFFELRRPCSQLSGKFACESSQVVNNVLCAYIKQIYIYIYESQLIG